MSLLTDKYKTLHAIVWQRDLSGISSIRLRLIQAARVVYLVVRDFLEGQLTLRAMSLVYTTLLSLVPLLAVSFSVLKGFGIHNQVEPFLLNWFEPLGEKGKEIAAQIIGFVENVKVTVLGSLGLLLLLYTVISLVQKVERAFNFIWHVGEHRPFVQRFSDYLSVILIGPLLVFTAIGVMASLTGASAVQQVLGHEALSWIVQLVGRLLPYGLIIGAFTIVYMFIPNTRVKFVSAFVGASVAGVLWASASWVFSAFVANSVNYTAIYSAFASLIVFMIWLYFDWMILLLGASIAFYHQHPEFRKLESRSAPISFRMQEKLILTILAIIAERFEFEKPPYSLTDLSKHLNVSIESLSPLMEFLVKEGVLIKTDATEIQYVPAKAIDRILIADILSMLKRMHETESVSLEQMPAKLEVDTLLEKIQHDIDKEIGGLTIKEIISDKLDN